MINIEFPTWDKDSDRIIKTFEDNMFMAHRTEHKGMIVLGALVFMPDGHMVSTISPDNLFLNCILEKIEENSIEYDMIGG